jgi:hypothetical protein
MIFISLNYEQLHPKLAIVVNTEQEMGSGVKPKAVPYSQFCPDRRMGTH